ncbi:RRQRL motif-containing zinc-binding protein [Streptomyces sp. NPDC007905]|uniref:RRQRL motif-containing zinc-binding protein n=1 Tax=Streptomyces sp. NPDC007905 TaxID=3364788 RepID=UPI0036EBD8E2
MPQPSRTNPRVSSCHNPPSASVFPTRRPSDSVNPLISEFDRGAVPGSLATRRKLRVMGLSPGDNDGPVAILRCKWRAYRPQWSCNHPTRGFLIRVDLAKPKRTPTLAQERALDMAMAARQTCGGCGRRFYFCLSKKLGCCLECFDGTPVEPSRSCRGRTPSVTTRRVPGSTGSVCAHSGDPMPISTSKPEAVA